jgi:hypothetical protein
LISKLSIVELAQEIYNDIEHGECLYELDEKWNIINRINDLKNLINEYYIENK